MGTKNNRDEFDRRVATNLAKRASYICSNPDCRALTVAPSEIDPEQYIYVGKAAHITAAARKGPRHDATLTPEQRSSIENAIFLCSGCADMIDKNSGLDFSVPQLKNWKTDHDKWVRGNLNKSVTSLISTVDGEHRATGRGNITALDVQAPVFFKPGTKSSAEGEGNITATRISYNKE